MNYRELISSFTREDYENNLVDLHIHTVASDGLGQAQDLIAQAQQHGYKYIAFTDHNVKPIIRHVEASEQKDEAERDCLMLAQPKHLNTVANCDNIEILREAQNDENKPSTTIIPACEFDVWCGYVFCHLLAYGINPENEELKPFFAQSKRETEVDIVRILSKRDMKKLIEAIHAAGGIAVLAHPCCCWALSLDRLVKKLASYGLDGLEVYYPYRRHRGIVKFHLASTVEKLADKYNLIKTGGSDTHGVKLA